LRISSLIRSRSWRTSSADFVRLPENRHFLGKALLDGGALVGREPRIVEPDELLRDADVREQDGAPGRLGRMSGQDESDRRRRASIDERVGRDRVELTKRVLERLARDDAVVGVFPSASQTMVLFREVRELEVQPERAQHEHLLLAGERRRGARDRAVRPRGPCVPADRLDELEQPIALLLDEHGAENRPEKPNVAAERCSGVAAG
jgi:hypothetical protein